MSAPTDLRASPHREEAVREHAHKLSLIVPIFNEGPHLRRFLAEVDAFDFAMPVELVFVDDASTDGSKECLENFKFRGEVQRLFRRTNRGKGAALREAIRAATGSIIGIQDADFEYSLDDIRTLVEPIVRDEADITFGSRFKRSTHQIHRTYHYLVNRFLTALSNALSGIYLTDMETCYKFFKAEILKNIQLESNRFGFEPEVTAKLARLLVRVHEYPIRYFPRDYIEGKKITWRDGIAAMHHIVYFNLIADRNRFLLSSMPAKYLPAQQRPR